MTADGVGTEGAITPEDEMGAVEMGSMADVVSCGWEGGGSGRVVAGGDGWVEFGEDIEPGNPDTRLIGTRSLPWIRRRL
jgi:hypothetical protein